MKVFLAAAVAATIVAIGAAWVLEDNFGQTSIDAFTTTGARL